MYKKIIQDIKELGFSLYDSELMDGMAFYETYIFFKDSSRLEVTFEFDKTGEMVKSYVEFENIKLKGMPVTVQNLQQLIKFIYNIDYENRS